MIINFNKFVSESKLRDRDEGGKKKRKFQPVDFYKEIDNKKSYSKFYKAEYNELVIVSDFFRWLDKKNIKPREEAVYAISRI